MSFLQTKALLSLFLFLSLAGISYGWPAPTMGHSPPGCKQYTKLLPRNKEYKEHCEAEAGPSGSDPKWPCFTMWYSDLTTVSATVNDGKPDPDNFFYVNDGKIDPDDFFYVKDGDKLDFTIKDPKLPFRMTWMQELTMYYSDHDSKTGCYNITLTHPWKTQQRIWVSDENGKDRDIDTLNYQWTSKILCTKWLHIHVKEDGHDD